MKEKRWTGGAPLTMSPSLRPLGSGSPGDTEERTTGSDRPQGRGPSGGGRGVCNCQGSRGLGRALGVCLVSPCWSALGRLWPIRHHCWASAGWTQGEFGVGRRCRSREPLMDKAALLVLRGPFTHTRTAWEARPTGVGSGGGSLPYHQPRRDGGRVTPGLGA